MDNFYQSAAEDNIQNLGAGVGLYLCKELIQSLGGEIYIQSQLNQGTTVKFMIQI
jgi:signal transduction histidine kinase